MLRKLRQTTVDKSIAAAKEPQAKCRAQFSVPWVDEIRGTTRRERQNELINRPVRGHWQIHVVAQKTPAPYARRSIYERLGVSLFSTFGKTNFGDRQPGGSPWRDRLLKFDLVKTVLQCARWHVGLDEDAPLNRPFKWRAINRKLHFFRRARIDP